MRTTQPRPESERRHVYANMVTSLNRAFDTARELGITALLQSDQYGLIEIIAGEITAETEVTGIFAPDCFPITTIMEKHAAPTGEPIAHLVQGGGVIGFSRTSLRPSELDVAAHIANEYSASNDAYTIGVLADTKFDKTSADKAAALLIAHPGMFRFDMHLTQIIKKD